MERNRRGHVVELGGETMGTSWSVRLVVPSGTDEKAVKAGIETCLATVIDQMSNWEEASDISRFNRSVPGEWQSLPPEFMTVLNAGLQIAEISGGAFDPAVGGMVNRWGFGPAGRGQSPAYLPASGNLACWQSIEADGMRARRLADVSLDFSGIAKGYAVDLVSAWLSAQEYEAHLTEIGGELKGCGIKPDGQPWWVDWEVPPGLSLPPVCFALFGVGIATSGDYRRWYQQDGVRLSHSIDPREGGPVTNGVASVTVVHESTMIADAWATALLVLGLEGGLKLAAEQDLAVLMVRREEAGAKDYMSPAFAAMLSD